MAKFVRLFLLSRLTPLTAITKRVHEQRAAAPLCTAFLIQL
jgi:hypothetical protein